MASLFTIALLYTTVHVFNFMGKIFVACQKGLYVNVLNFVGINFRG